MNIQNLITKMLDKKPENRPSASEILKLDFIKDEVNNLLIKHQKDYSHMGLVSNPLLYKSPILRKN